MKWLFNMKYASPETDFENNLAKVAPLCSCRYVKIKDTRSINAGNRKTHREVQRPCDALISTPKWNWFIECKIGYAKLKPHQAKLRDEIYETNGRFAVLRKLFLKSGVKYRIDLKDETWKTDDLKDIFKVLDREEE